MSCHYCMVTNIPLSKVEDISPLLVYNPAGEWDYSPNDPFLQPHANGTFHATQYPVRLLYQTWENKGAVKPEVS